MILTRIAVCFFFALGSSLALATEPTDSKSAQGSIQKKQAKSPPQRCDVPLWSMDPDPNGLNVRKSPEAKADVLGQLPPETMFTAVNAKNGRFEFKDPQEWNWPEAERIPLKKGPKRGWVYGGLVGIDTECRRDKDGRAVLTVYTEPDETSPPVVTWVAGQEFSCDWKIDKALDCQGRWLKMSMRKGPGSEEQVQGWLHPENLCDNPLTTCAGY